MSANLPRAARELFNILVTDSSEEPGILLSMKSYYQTVIEYELGEFMQKKTNRYWKGNLLFEEDDADRMQIGCRQDADNFHVYTSEQCDGDFSRIPPSRCCGHVTPLERCLQIV